MTAIALYVLMGLALLVSFAVLGFLDFSLLFYLGVFFILTYLTLGSLMAAIGAAVNELNEAQSLMGPLMLVLILPMAMIVPIVQNPNSTFSTLVSFVPPVNTFAMLLRMSSTAPPPLWQVWLSIGVAAVGALGAIWFSSKVFRIGLLMYGKPPNFATLVRWVRAA
jgi:ABC-2 type transport system permease protein